MNSTTEPKLEADVLAAASRYISAVQAACQGRKFFSTQSGRLGIGPPTIKPQDRTVAFDSAGPVLILRVLEHSDAFTLVGDAYVCDLMTTLQVEKHKLRDHEIFTLK